jgi:hypothetical protein
MTYRLVRVADAYDNGLVGVDSSHYAVADLLVAAVQLQCKRGWLAQTNLQTSSRARIFSSCYNQLSGIERGGWLCLGGGTLPSRTLESPCDCMYGTNQHRTRARDHRSYSYRSFSR